jgi:intergrase/recombinase
MDDEFIFVPGESLDNFQSLDEVKKRIEEIAVKYDITISYVRGYATIAYFSDKFGSTIDFYIPSRFITKG